MVSSSRPIMCTLPAPRHSAPISFASRLTFITFMLTLALSIITPTTHALYLTPSDCPIQHCLLDTYQPTKDYFPIKLETVQQPNFAIEYYHHFKVLRNRFTSEEYVITLCGTPEPVNNTMVYRTINGAITQVPLVLAPTAKLIRGPITSVAVLETVPANMLELLGARSTIRHMNTQYVTSPCIKSMAQLQIIKNNLTAALPNVDVVLGGNTRNARAKYVQVSVTLETTPLRRLEWIKFMGALLNREHAAQMIYDDTVERYTALQSKVASVTTSPVVAWLSSYEGWQIGTADYKMQLTRDAGATPFIPTKTSFNNVTELVETLRAGSVDIIIDETWSGYYTKTGLYDDFLTFWGNLTVDMKFVANKQVWRNDRMQTATSGDDWFERAVVQVDAVLQDFIAITHPEVFGASVPAKVWFRNFPSAEPQFMTLDRCADVSAPLFPLLATPTVKSATCPQVPIETLIGYVAIGGASSTGNVVDTITTSTGVEVVPSSTGVDAVPSSTGGVPSSGPSVNGVSVVRAGIITVLSMIAAVLLM